MGAAMKHIVRFSILVIAIVSFMSEKSDAADAYDLVRRGGELSAKQAESLEKTIAGNPDDVDGRVKLLGYYSRKQYQDSTARKNLEEHVLWLIRNAPESDVFRTGYATLDATMSRDAYAQGKEAWIAQLDSDPENLAVLEHASDFFQQHDRELAIETLQKGRVLDPDEPKWPAALGQIYSLDMITRSRKAKTEAAVRALEQFEIAYELSTEMGRDVLRANLAKTALVANRPGKAKKYAEEMLSNNAAGWNYGNNIHAGNSILGRLALADGDVEKAKAYLLKAGATPGSPQLNSFGPDMTLAQELLRKGETEVVLEYFDLCAKFWEMGRDNLDEWTMAIENGKTPSLKLY
jgi:tetratricopeptide (TPR) repeat protein